MQLKVYIERKKKAKENNRHTSRERREQLKRVSAHREIGEREKERERGRERATENGRWDKFRGLRKRKKKKKQ